MTRRPFTLEDFVRESNRIEGIPEVRGGEILAHEDFLGRDPITIENLAALVWCCAGPGAPLRDREGMNVRVGPHIPPSGGPKLLGDLRVLIRGINDRRLTAWEAHHRYETLHPFMDGNGRSGRALWLKMMGGIEMVPLGFLHTWYYQSLQEHRA